MEHGDLTVVNRPTIVVVLEGVLCGISMDEDSTRLTNRLRSRLGMKPSSDPGMYKHAITWWPIPLKRLATMIRGYDVDIDVVTFMSQEIADEAAEFFNDIGLHIATVSYQDFDRWVQTLPFQVIQQVIDSNQSRLDRYGQLGRSVTMGEDF